jgi:hypothetical protein
MTQATHDYSIANDTGSAVRTDLNTLFGEVETANSGTTAPSNLATGKLWYDTGNNLLKQYDGSSWVTIMDSTGGTFTGAVTLPSPVINTGVSGTAVLDEDDLVSDSATKLASQQSIKAYVDGVGSQTGADAQALGTGDSPTFAGKMAGGTVIDGGRVSGAAYNTSQTFTVGNDSTYVVHGNYYTSSTAKEGNFSYQFTVDGSGVCTQTETGNPGTTMISYGTNTCTIGASSTNIGYQGYILMRIQ